MSKFKPAIEPPIQTDVQTSAAERPPARVVRDRPVARTLQAQMQAGTRVNSAVLETQDLESEQSAITEAPKSGALSLALLVTLLFIFFRFSFLHEVITIKLGVDLHILMIVGALSILTSLISGDLFIGLGNRIALAWFGFVGCMIFATLFSTWRGGSLGLLYPYLRTTFVLLVLIPAVVQSSKSLVALMNVIGLAGFATMAVGLLMSDFRTGRLELSAADESMANSNDYAAIVMLMMPPIAFLTLRRGTNIALKIVGCGALALACFLVLSTGSRGALISMVLSALYLVIVGSNKVRAAILLGLPLAALLAIPLLPGEASARLATLFNKKDNVDSEALASQIQRTALLMESLRITIQHPAFGVGPGNFQTIQAREASAVGEHGMWHETHNSYTQISSECGIPAFVFYLSAIVMTLIVFTKGRKSRDPNIRDLCSVLSLMLVSFMVCMFFLAQGYGFEFPVLGGIAIAIDRILKQEKALAAAYPDVA